MLVLYIKSHELPTKYVFIAHIYLLALHITHLKGSVVALVSRVTLLWSCQLSRNEKRAGARRNLCCFTSLPTTLMIAKEVMQPYIM